jgi:hypothetical protein
MLLRSGVGTNRGLLGSHSVPEGERWTEKDGQQ